MFRVVANELGGGVRLWRYAEGRRIPVSGTVSSAAGVKCERLSFPICHQPRDHGCQSLLPEGDGPDTQSEGSSIRATVGVATMTATPWIQSGPIKPRIVIIIGSWWMTREVELCNARSSHVHKVGEGLKLVATWAPPASNTDLMALGVDSAHGCGCSGTTPRAYFVGSAEDAAANFPRQV